MTRTRMTMVAGLAVAMLSGCTTHVVATTETRTVQQRQVVVAGPPARVQPQGQVMYTMANLRPNRAGVISSVAYTHVRGPVLPMCTPVRIDRVRGRQIVFTSLNDGRRFRYVLHRSARSGVMAHQQRYFGPQCPDLRSMRPEDVSGIQNAAVYQGMTKAGVIAAIGYPPEHRTQTLEGDVWLYWASRMGRFEVYFTNGVVSGMRH